MKKNEKGRECATYGARGAYQVRWANLRKRERERQREHLEDAGVNGTIILKGIFTKTVGGTDWIYLPQDRDRWRDLVNVVKTVKFHKIWGIS
jgi:hypothetical protein